MAARANGGTSDSWRKDADTEQGSTSQTSEIKDLLLEFHCKISDKIETSQKSMKENFEQSQMNMRENIITEFKGLMTTQVLNPLKNQLTRQITK